jgi:hypothetical protein
MPAIHVLKIPEFEPIRHTAEQAGMRQEDTGDYLRMSTPAPEVVLERRHTGVRPAVWFAALTGGMEGRVVAFDEDRLTIVALTETNE